MELDQDQNINIDISTKIKFHDVCQMFEKIQRASGISQKEAILRCYLNSFNEFCEEFRQTHGQDATKCNFFPILRCLIPSSDHSRNSYGLQVTTMGKLFVKILNLPPNGDDAKKLTYNKPVKDTKDFADIVYSIMKNRSQEVKSSLTMAYIHKLLDIVAENDRRVSECEFTKFVNSSTALEQKWLIRIILKKLHIGLGEKKILSIYHPQANDAFVRHTNLEKVCECLESGEEIDMDTVKPFQPVRPMLCEHLDMQKLKDIIKNNCFYVETKMDGERFQLHIKDECYKYISRSGKDFTKNFGNSDSEGNLTPFITKLFTKNIINIILDGEMMVWDKELASYRVKGENIDVKSLQIGTNLRPCFVVYDILYLNNVSLIDKPYAERISLLHMLLKEKSGILALCKRTKIKDIDHLLECFNDALNANEEGIVIKRDISIYKPGMRNASGWYKLKPDYVNGLISEFDLLIIGGFYNRKRTFIKSYLLGVYKKDEDKECFYSVGKVGLGLSFQESVNLNVILKPHWKNVKNSNAQLPFIEWGQTAPDVYIEPKDSIILQIRATELSPTNSYRTPYALRFPRIQAIRNDKVWNECMTLEEYQSFYKGRSGVEKIAKRQLDSNDLVTVKKIKITAKEKFENRNNFYSTNFDESELSKISNICEGLEFCILSSLKSKMTITDLKKIVIRHNGTIVENPTTDSKKCICLAGDITYRVQKLIETGLYNIISVNWFIKTFTNENVLPRKFLPGPRDMIYITTDMKDEFKKSFDQYGDSYTEKINIEELENLTNEMNTNNIKLLDSEILDIENEIYGNTNNPNIFRTINGYFYSENSSEMSNICILSALIFKSKGGIDIKTIDTITKKKITYIFVDKSNIDMKKFQQWIYCNFGSRMNQLLVLTCDYLLHCDQSHKKLEHSNYIIKLDN